MLAILVVFYILGGIGLYFGQGYLMFPGAFIHDGERAIVGPGPDREMITLHDVGGHRVTAVFGVAEDAEGNELADAKSRPTLLYLYGNGDCMATSMSLFRKFRRLGANVMIPEYLGYPMSSGKPGEQAFYDTADAAYSYLVARVNSDTTSFSDTAVSGSHAYSYQVQAVSGKKNAPVSKTVSISMPLAAPTNLTGAYQGNSIQLEWTDADPSATGYLVFRSSDGNTFSPLAKISGATANSFTDTAVTAGRTYQYEVEATTATKASAPSTPVVVAPTSSPDSVSISTRFGNELVITASGDYDSISLSQSGSNLTITANGTTFTNTVPASGVFVYTRGGLDAVTLAPSVTVRTTIDTIDAASTTITSSGSNVSVWMDSTDSFTGTGTVHSVATFAGNVSKNIGASLADPSDSGPTFVTNLSLWGVGPVPDDVNQGGIGDCYFLSTLAAFAGTNPSRLSESAVDLGDGTYAVQFFNAQNKPVYVRVSDTFSTGWFDGFQFAHPGANNTIWAMVMEKALCYFRTGANTYSSIESGWMGEAYSDLGVANTFFSPSSFSESSFYAMVSTDLSTKKPVTLAAANAPDVVNNHAYTLIRAYTDSSGSTRYVIRNPWGASGDSLEDANGYATLTFSQLVANFVQGCAAA